MKHLLIMLVKFYRKFISPLFPPCCKYYPTCSTYALTAIERFGAFRGILLTAWRLIRCNPWSMGGIDYVPEKFTFRIKKYDYTSCDCYNQHDDDKDIQN
ncbi:MAG: membrane protein insertion efficiency factor YidD [Ruminococcus sp.]|nr:membrane protein insertion efficiency factor YidD [Ruminococcus sp.]